MNAILITTLSIVMVGLGAAASLNLLRIFVRDWRQGRREERRQSFRSSARKAEATTVIRRPLPAALAASLVLTSLLSVAARGQDAPAQAAPGQPPAIQAQPVKSPFSLQLNFDYTTAYFYHGIVQEDVGLILQPAAKLTINLYEQDDLKVDALLGTWNSFHGERTASRTHSDFTDYWYESDLIGGVVLTKGKASLTTTYTFLTSPSDAYETVQELDFTLAYDDGDLFGKWAMHPYALVGFETGADASDGADSDAGTYLELGVAPGFSFDAGKTPIAISFPVSVGMSLNNYYQNAAGSDDTFGFAQVGVKASIPLPFAERWGKWSINAGVFGLFLGDHTADYNTGNDSKVIATIGLQANF